MIKKYITAFLAKNLNKLLFINDQNKLRKIYDNPGVSVGQGVVIEEYFSANLPSDSFSLILGAHVRIKKYCYILLFPKAVLTINDNVFINNYCSINCLEKITIGENTMFGEGVRLYDHNHLITKENNQVNAAKDQFKTAPITIGKNCWIGSNVTILKGVTIGNNVIIGANCLIYKSVPANTVVKAKTEYITEDRS